MSDSRLRRINFALLGCIILVNLYTIVLPLAPRLSYWWRTRNTSVATSSVQTYLNKTRTNTTSTPKTDDTAAENRLIIPRMLLDTAIIEGSAANPYANLKKGAWHLPFSATPDQGGNTVIAGHRFTYTESQSVFYHLDKLQIGDEIGVQWDGTMYLYKVATTKVVPSTATSVQESTSDTRLTLYTCTPLWNPTDRLVVIAKPIGGSI